MINKTKGFTLIELVIVMVILGILAAVAIPKFIDLTAQASTASVNGLAGSLSAANAINVASCKAGGTCGPVAKCSDVGLLLTPSLVFTATVNTVGTPYVTADSAAASGVNVSCTLNINRNSVITSATYTAIGTP